MKNPKHLIIGLIIAALASFVTFRNISWDELAVSFEKVNYIYLIPTVLISILSFVTRAFRWQVLLQPLKKIETQKLFSPLMVGYMGNLLPARAGEVIRAWLVCKQDNITFSGAFATIIVERISDLIMLFSLFIWLLLFETHIFKADIQWAGIPLSEIAFNFGILGIIMVTVLFIFIYLVLFHRPRMIAFFQWFTRPLPKKWHDTIEQLFEKFSEGLNVIRDVNALIKLALWTVVTWLLMTLSYYPLYWAYDLENKSIDSIILLIVMICIFISAFPTPGFVGSFHAGIVIALHSIMGETEIIAASFSMVAWAVNMVIIVAGGVYFILHEHLSVKKLSEIEKAS